MSERKDKLNKNWVALLNEAVQAHGIVQVGKELDCTVTEIALVASDKYPGDTTKIARKVMAIYGAPAIACPALGDIQPNVCAGHYGQAKKVGMIVSNPEKIRLHHACLKCTLRS